MAEEEGHVNRELYCSPNIDADRMAAYALERAKEGERVVLHRHAKGGVCPNSRDEGPHCLLHEMKIMKTLWTGPRRAPTA